MALQNKFLLQNIEKLVDDKIRATPVQINFNPERIRGTKTGGYLSERLKRYKKSLDPLNKQSMRTTIMNKLFLCKQAPNNSPNKILPKLHRYAFPLEQKQSQNVNIPQKSRTKVSSVKVIRNSQKQKIKIDKIESESQINKILLQMFAEQDIVSKRIKIAMQNSQLINNDFKRRSVAPRIQNIVCSGNQYGQSIKVQAQKDHILPRQLSHKRRRSCYSQMRTIIKQKPKKYKQLKGWQVQYQYQFI